jgi:hypothetical protein
MASIWGIKVEGERNIDTLHVLFGHHAHDIELPFLRFRTVNPAGVVTGVVDPDLSNTALGQFFDQWHGVGPWNLVFHVTRQ